MKKLLAVVLSASTLMTTVGASSVYALNQDELYRDMAVNALRTASILKGDENGNLNLYDPVKRGQLMALIIRTNDEEDEAKSEKYQNAISIYTDDSQIADWERGYINYGTEKGYINGYPDGSVMTVGSILYEEAIKLVVATKEDGKEYIYPQGYIERAEEAGWLKGVYGEVGKPIAREAIATLIYNAFEVDINNLIVKNETVNEYTNVIDDDYVYTEADITINNIADYANSEMAIDVVVNAGIIDLDENGNFNGNKEMTVAEVNTTVRRMAKYISQTSDFPEIEQDIPQITNKGGNEIATVKDVVDLLRDPGVEKVKSDSKWVEINDSKLKTALKNILIPETDAEWAMLETQLKVPALQVYTVNMIYRSINTWRIIKHWSDGYTVQNSAVGNSGNFAAYDGRIYYYALHNPENTGNVAGVYSETDGIAKKILDNSSIKIIGAYNGYLFYEYQGDIWRISSSGKYNRQLTFGGKVGSAMTDMSYSTVKDYVISGDELYYCSSTGAAYSANIDKYYKVDITSENFDNDKVEISKGEMERLKYVDGYMYSAVAIRQVLYNTNYEIFKKEDLSEKGATIKVYESATAGAESVPVYNGNIYHIVELDGDILKFNKVNLNGNNTKTIADVTDERKTSTIHKFDISVVGDYAFLKINNGFNTYCRININEESNDYGEVNEIICPN